MIKKFYENFGSEYIAVIHSRIRKEEKLYWWHKIIKGEANIVLGARSAVFAPFKNLGLIILDEESDPSYKSNSTPRYNARQVAFIRAKNENAVLVMGTATPSVETFYFAKEGKIKLFTLKERYMKRPLPYFSIIDLKNEKNFSKNMPLSQKLIEEIDNNLKKNEQVILFINRRGFSNYIICKNCGYVFKCPHCNISLTYHKVGLKLLCHYCGFTRNVPDKCERCGSINLLHRGAGTQKIENVLKKIFKDCNITRMDTDSTRRKGKISEIIRDFEEGKINIITGTQLISKGLNFPYVTLVGILFIDEILNIPDFRASENVFTHIIQVSGRAGRGELPGRVLIQTFIPDNYAIKFATEYNYEKFYEYEIELRKKLNYPPFCRLVKIIFEGKKNENVQLVSNEIKNFIQKNLENLENIELLGPIPAPIAKLKGKFRYQILLKVKRISDVKKLLTEIPVSQKNVHIIIDVDPYSLL